MATTGWVLVGSGADSDAVGNDAWSNPSKITASDDDPATCTTATATHLIVATMGASALSVPAGSQIDNASGRFRVKAGVADNFFFETGMMIVIAGTPVELSVAVSGYLGTDYANFDSTALDASALETLALTAAKVNHTGFGVAASLTAENESDTASIDAVWVKVDYTAPGGPRGRGGGRSRLRGRR